MEIQLTLATKDRFLAAAKSDVQTAGWLIGWHTENGIVVVGCIACSGSTPYILVQDVDKRLGILPAGLDLVGVFMCTKQGLDANEIEDYLGQLLLAGYKNLDETSEFCYTVMHQDNCIGYMYNNSRQNAQPVRVTFIDREQLYSQCSLIRVQGMLPISYELQERGESDDDGLIATFDNLQNQVMSPVTAFHLKNSEVLLCNQKEFEPSINGLRYDTPCSELQDFISDEDDGNDFASAKEKKYKSVVENNNMRMQLLFKITGDDAIQRTISCLPIIHYQKREFQNISLTIPIDFVVLVPKNHPVSKLVSIMVNGVVTQLDIIKQTLIESRNGKLLPAIEIFHFVSAYCDHFVTLILPLLFSDHDLENKRRQYHQWLLLPEDRPLLRRGNRYSFPEDRTTTNYLTNVHVGLPNSGVKHGQVSIVSGTYTYHHYKQDHFDDNGWGCAYRSLQTIVSWFRHQAYTDQPIPTHEEIQKALVDVGDKPNSFIGSKRWIGSLEVSYCLDKLIGVAAKIMNLSSGSDLSIKGRELAIHFKTQGTPIMIGGGVLAHTIIGVDFNDSTGDLKFLVLDPHYTGTEDLYIIQNKGWCTWRGIDYWDPNTYYNLCLPQRPLVL
uniref:Probable Ufm1-specific protease 2 n=1 Tax=Strigamia maritima TaxID=126957 RepID=T1IZG3_STRMM